MSEPNDEDRKLVWTIRGGLRDDKGKYTYPYLPDKDAIQVVAAYHERILEEACKRVEVYSANRLPPYMQWELREIKAAIRGKEGT